MSANRCAISCVVGASVAVTEEKRMHTGVDIRRLAGTMALAGLVQLIIQ